MKVNLVVKGIVSAHTAVITLEFEHIEPEMCVAVMESLDLEEGTNITAGTRRNTVTYRAIKKALVVLLQYDGNAEIAAADANAIREILETAFSVFDKQPAASSKN